MSSTPRKPVGSSATPFSAGRRASNDSSPNRTSVGPTVSIAAGQGLARSPSIRQVRPARKAPSRSSTSLAADTVEDEEESRAMSSDLIAELKEQVKRTEAASEQYRKQLEVLQRRLDESTEEQTAAEEREYQRQSELDRVRVEVKDAARQRREMQNSHEAEKSLLLNERETHATREAEMQSVINRLNETLRTRESRRSSTGNALDLGQGSDPDPGGNGSDFSRIMQDKNTMIESLRLELAESQIKVAEMEHVGDGRLQQLEKNLMEAKMANARLQEDNESFQYLLSEKTLKGDFMSDARPVEETSGLSSLAEELESAGDDGEGQTEGYKRLEGEIKSLRDANKALTLYIDKIIGRLLQHEGFEHIIHDKDEAPAPPTKSSRPSIVEKALPATPDTQAAPSPGPSLLQRAKSVVSRPAGPRARPVSMMPSGPSSGVLQSANAPSANENPETAPSIPLNRGHRRARSDQAQKDMGAAALVAQMNRGSPLRTVSGGAMSPGISPLSPSLNPTRVSYFQSATTTGQRNISTSRPTSRDRDRGSSANSVTSDISGEKNSTDASSAQASTQGSNNIPGAVMKQNQLRPLRLVQQADEQDQKKANRGSWMGWLKGSSLDASNA